MRTTGGANSSGVSTTTSFHDVRAAGALVSLYGLTLSAITRLTADRLVRQDKGRPPDHREEPRHPSPAPGRPPDRLGRHSTVELGRRTRGPGNGLVVPRPGTGRHITANYLNTKLIAAGIQVRRTRNAALFALAEDLPAAVLADLLGMHVNTAERWAKLARRDWADYLQARTAVEGGKGATP